MGHVDFWLKKKMDKSEIMYVVFLLKNYKNGYLFILGISFGFNAIISNENEVKLKEKK